LPQLRVDPLTGLKSIVAGARAERPGGVPFRLVLAPRRARARFEDVGPSGAALLHDALRRLRVCLGASPPLNLWVRTAPRGAEL
jgi:hypothetical protein